MIFAIERFDVSKGFEFSSFATPTIIDKVFWGKGWSIRVPRRIQEHKSKYVNPISNKNFCRVPKIEDIAKYLDCTEEEVLEAIEASHVYKPKSLDLSYDNEGDDKDILLLDLVGDDDKSFNMIENKDFIENALSENSVKLKQR